MNTRPMTAHEIEALAYSTPFAASDANHRSECRRTLETAGRAITRWLVYAAQCAAADGVTYHGGMWRERTTPSQRARRPG
jgi:hypothetical protein